MWRAEPRSPTAWWRIIKDLSAEIRLIKNPDILVKISRKLAEVSGVVDKYKIVLRRILPKDDVDINYISDIANKMNDLSIDELRSIDKFCSIFLNIKLTKYQMNLVSDTSRRIAVVRCRQSGKSLAIAVKSIHFSITRPHSKIVYVAPSFRQSKLSFRKVNDVISLLSPVARRAWILEELRTKIKFINGSEIEAFPYALERLRGATCDFIFVDEAAFVPDDEELFEAILKPMLATRWEKGAQLIACSTPWGKNSYFYRIFKDPKISQDWSHHVWTWREAVEEGIIPMSFIESEMRTKDLSYFKREYEAEFLEDEDSWLPFDLINCCLDSEETFWRFEDFHKGEFYFGIDLGKKLDHSVLTVIERISQDLYVRHVKIWPLETPYSSVIGYVKTLAERWRSPYKILVDQTGVGDYILEDMVNVGIPNLEGVFLTSQKKVEIASYLKQKMQEGCVQDSKGKWTGISKLHIPYTDDRELISRIIAELNVEKYTLTKDGGIKLYHPEGTHDDVFWSIALAVYASKYGSSDVRLSAIG